jgi:primary-amine oxidase
LLTVTREDAGPFGKLLGKPGDRPTIVQEVRDRGIMWMDGNKKRRGQKLLLWGTLDAANYRYIIEYGFQDDGTITFRVGSTGHNYASREWEGHMHNGLWRVDINLDGPHHNSVLVMVHLEPDGAHKEKARTEHRPFNGGREGYLDWNAERFTMLTIVNEKKKNIRGKPWSYDLVPLRMGNARHYAGDKEECTQHDFWVTRARKDEIYYTRVHKYAEKGESIQDSDVILWHSSAGHHEPRSEDGEMKGTNFVGATPVMWCGFDLRPRNLFDRSPLYP